ncbi:hypothetical protein V1264_002470 [Littorina saxatilis]|uniref:Transposable element Tc1 transposase n=1 Tax=Littorina saxatilis TaxID=31220 RepID=A0AAN9C4A9_9CAEN
MATRRCCCQASGPEACSGSLCHHQTKTEIPRNWKSAGATTFWSAQSHHTKRGSLHSEAGHATQNGYGKNIRQRIQATTNTAVSGQTIRNRLHNFGLRARRPVRGTTLTANHRAARRAWCTQHVRWQRQQWAQVLFTDESRFCLEPADGRIRVWRRRGERFAEGAVLERQRFGGGSVMVWGGISTRLRTPLYHVVGNLTGVRYQNEILQPLVVPALQAIGPRAILQDDNAPPHLSAAVNTVIQQARVNRMLWPANSPDLNPIEHMWDELCRREQQHHPPPANLGQLLQWLQQEWNGVPRAFICNLIHSMRQRCVECLAHNGGHTRY